MKKIFINVPMYGQDDEDYEKTISIIKGICKSIYSFDDESVEFVTPLYEHRDHMYGYIESLKLLNDCDYYVKVDKGDVYDELYLGLESASRIYRDEFRIIDLTSLTKLIAPQLFDD